jgi:FkbM family methyltransferase
MIGRIFCSYHGNSFFDALGKIAAVFLKAYENQDFDMERNGEERIVKIISSLKPRCVFDVGANVGEWSLLVSRFCPKCEIHAFEIRTETFNKLKNKFAGYENIHLNDFGLSDSEGKIEIYYSSENELDPTSTAYPLFDMKENMSTYGASQIGKVRRGENYIDDNDILDIDFLKIDVEGMELLVIKGFAEGLRKVKVIQFEYGIFNHWCPTVEKIKPF